MKIIHEIERNCHIKNVIVEYCSAGYFSTLEIDPIYFRVYNEDGVEWGVANSISIEDSDSPDHYQIFFELDGMTVAFFDTIFIEKISIKRLKNDDFKQMRREYHGLFKE